MNDLTQVDKINKLLKDNDTGVQLEYSIRANIDARGRPNNIKFDNTKPTAKFRVIGINRSGSPIVRLSDNQGWTNAIAIDGTLISPYEEKELIEDNKSAWVVNKGNYEPILSFKPTAKVETANQSVYLENNSKVVANPILEAEKMKIEMVQLNEEVESLKSYVEELQRKSDKQSLPYGLKVGDQIVQSFASDDIFYHYKVVYLNSNGKVTLLPKPPAMSSYLTDDKYIYSINGVLTEYGKKIAAEIEKKLSVPRPVPRVPTLEHAKIGDSLAFKTKGYDVVWTIADYPNTHKYPMLRFNDKPETYLDIFQMDNEDHLYSINGSLTEYGKKWEAEEKRKLPVPRHPSLVNAKVGDKLVFKNYPGDAPITRIIYNYPNTNEFPKIMSEDGLSPYQMSSARGLFSIGDCLTDHGIKLTKEEIIKTEKELAANNAKLGTDNKVLTFQANGLGWIPTPDPTHKVFAEFVNNKEPSQFLQEISSTAYRVAATQAISFSKNALVNLLQSKGESEDTLTKIGSLLDTEFGKTLLSMTLGMGLSQISTEQNQPKLHRFAKECRIQSMTTIGNSIANTVVEAVIDVLQRENEDEEEYLSSSNLEEYVEERLTYKATK